MSHLDALMNAVLNQLKVVSTASAAGLGERTSHAKAGTKPPPLASAPHIDLAQEYERAITDDDRRVVIRKALTKLKEIRYSRKPTVDCQTREGRLMVGLDDRPMEVVTFVYGYSRGHIYKLRAEARRFVGQTNGYVR